MPECQPQSQKAVGDLITYLRGTGIASLYGPDFDAQRNFICDSVENGGLGADSSVCCYLTAVNAGYPEYTGEISLKQLEHTLQNSLTGKFCEYSPTFWVDGYYTPCTEIDLSANQVPIQNQLVADNEVCSEKVNHDWMVQAASPAYYGAHTWLDGRTHSGALGIQGDQDDDAYFILVGQLHH